jgi:hypothetical protein
VWALFRFVVTSENVSHVPAGHGPAKAAFGSMIGDWTGGAPGAGVAGFGGLDHALARAYPG